jgi:ABC-type transport system involved in Fe-S cluster assembly fused permease/ATPase subunit
MLLDEALDTQSEQLMQSLDQVRHGKAALVVPQRLSTVIYADKIFGFKDKHVAEVETREELMAQKGICANLADFRLQ